MNFGQYYYYYWEPLACPSQGVGCILYIPIRFLSWYQVKVVPLEETAKGWGTDKEVVNNFFFCSEVMIWAETTQL